MCDKEQEQHAALACGVAVLRCALVQKRVSTDGFRPARRGLDFQTTAGDGYSLWGIGTAREEEEENPISLIILQINHWIIL
jgi:hypothetical protein